MTDIQSTDFDQTVHVVDADHRKRAQIAMALSQSGGHAQIYDDIRELIAAKPDSGTILANSDTASVADLIAMLQAGEIFLPLIVFAPSPRPSQIVRAAHEGAADFLAWPFTGEELRASCSYCQQFMEGRGGVIRRRQKARKLIEGLSLRERQILVFLLEGHSNKSIANSLDLSPRTVEDYRLNTMRKLGVNATSAAIRIGLEAGLDGSAATSWTQTSFNPLELS